MYEVGTQAISVYLQPEHVNLTAQKPKLVFKYLVVLSSRLCFGASRVLC